MRRVGYVLLLWMLLYANLWAGKQSPLLSRLNAEFLGKSFQTKIVLGKYWLTFDEGTHQQVHRLIDTEMDASGNVQYYVRHGSAEVMVDLVNNGIYIKRENITATVPAKATVWVVKVELKDDRIEFQLSTNPAAARDSRQLTVDSYAKIKYVLGKGYDQNDYDKIVMVIAQGLLVQRVERQIVIASQYTSLKSQLPVAQAKYDSCPVVNTSEKLVAASQLQVILSELAQNRSEFAKQGNTDTEGTGYQHQAAALQPIIDQLQETRKNEQVATAQAKLNTTIVGAKRMSAEISSMKVGTAADLQHKKDLLLNYKAAITDAQELVNELQQLGRATTEADSKWLASQAGQLDSLARSIDRDQARVQTLELDKQYRTMQRKRADLQAAYMRAFGTAQEGAALEALRSWIRSMYDNRVAAQQVGSTTAASEANQLTRDLKKLN